MYDLDNLKLELKSKKQISRLDLVRARATMRTKRRIAEQLETQEMKSIEEQVALQEKAKPAVEVEEKKGK